MFGFNRKESGDTSDTKIETERLILRPFKKSDASDVFEYSKSPLVGPSAGWKPHENISNSNDFIRITDAFGILLKSENKIIGGAGLHVDEKRDYKRVKMLGYVLGESYWNKGYATEASMALLKFGFENLKLDIISAYHFPTNDASKRVIEKCGFKYEGVLRKATKLYDGQILDNVCHSITKEEYEKIMKAQDDKTVDAFVVL